MAITFFLLGGWSIFSKHTKYHGKYVGEIPAFSAIILSNKLFWDFKHSYFLVIFKKIIQSQNTY